MFTIRYTLLFLILALTICEAQPVSEVLGRPTRTSVTINVLFDIDSDVYFQYGSLPGIYDQTTQVTAAWKGIPVVAVFDRLLPDRKYYYRTCYRRAGTTGFEYGPEHSFHTQRARGKSFRFTIQADSHLYDKKGIPEMMRVTMRNQANDTPDFILDLGDTFGDDHEPTTITAGEMDQLRRDFLPYIGMACHSSPFFFCVGNHEGEQGYYLLQSPPNNIAVYAKLARKKYFSNPVPDGFYSGNSEPEPHGIGLPEDYYAWEWGDAQFIVLNTYTGSTTSAKPGDWDWTLGERQYQWFRDVLQSSTAKYRFVFAHHVSGEGRGGIEQATLFEWGGYDKKGKWGFTDHRPGWDATIHQLMVRHGVNIFFQGHDHLFAQEVLDGVIYQEVPMPSDSTYEIGMLANADAYVSNQVRGTGYLRVSVHDDSALVEFVRSWLPKDTSAAQRNSETAFSYAVAPRTVSAARQLGAVSGLRLEQNYPNPFTSATSIVFENPGSAAISLQVFDVMGRLVATLCDEILAEGRHARSWDGRRVDGTTAPGGVYLLRLQTGDGMLTRTIIRQ